MDFVARLRDFQAAYRGLAASRQAFDAKRASDAAFAAEIEALYGRFVGTFRRYCGNCWHDAFMQLLTLKKMENKSQFRLLAGTLLHDPVNREVRYMLTPRRLAEQGDELALRHLAHNPHAADYFEKPLPENLDELIAAYLEREAAAAEGASTPKAEKRTAKKGIVRKGTPRTKAKAEKEDESTGSAEEEAMQEAGSAAPAAEPVQEHETTGKASAQEAEGALQEAEKPSQEAENAGPKEEASAEETPDNTPETPDGMQATGKTAEA